MASAEDCLRALNARLEEFEKGAEDRVLAKLVAMFRTLRTTNNEEVQKLFNTLFSPMQARVDELERMLKDVGNRVTAPAVLPSADPVLSPCDAENMYTICADTMNHNFGFHLHQDRFARTELFRVRILRSKSTALLTCAATPYDVTRYLCCAPGIIEHVEEMRANGKGKPRMLVHFNSGAAAAAAFHSFKATSPNSSKADLTYKHSHLQNTLVNLAIQLQKVTRDTGLTDASFLARGDTIVFKEGPTAAAKEYPFIRHFWAGNPPPRGGAFNNVNATAVTGVTGVTGEKKAFSQNSRLLACT